MFEFCERVDLRAVNRRVVESFIKSGSFDSLEKRRAALMAAIDRAMEAGQKQQRDREQGQASLLGMLGGGDTGGHAPPSACPTWPTGRRASAWPTRRSRSASSSPATRWSASAPSSRSGPTPPWGRLAQLGEKEATVGGIVTALRLMKTKKGDRMATFMLEDLEGGVEVLVFPEAFKKAAAAWPTTSVVLVKGRAEALDEGRFRLLASDVLPLEAAKLADARFVTIRVPMGSWDKSKGERLRDILGAHKGDCPVTLEMVRPGGVRGGGGAQRVFPRAAGRGAAHRGGGAAGPGSLILARTSGAPA